MAHDEVLIPTRYNVYMQDLSSDYLRLELLGYVNTITEARTMVHAFRESFEKLNILDSIVFFQHESI